MTNDNDKKQQTIEERITELEKKIESLYDLFEELLKKMDQV